MVRVEQDLTTIKMWRHKSFNFGEACVRIKDIRTNVQQFEMTVPQVNAMATSGQYAPSLNPITISSEYPRAHGLGFEVDRDAYEETRVKA